MGCARFAGAFFISYPERKERKMKKKIFSAVLFAALLCLLCTTMTGCDCKHKKTDWETAKAATCTEEGLRKEVCEKCGETVDTETIAKRHTPGTALKENVVNVTATEKGSYDEVVYCTSCNAEISRTKKEIPIGSAVFPDDNNGGGSTADRTPTEGVVYTLSSDGTYATVTGYEGTATDVVIASTYQGVPVTSIGSRAFYYCISLTGVTIPDSVISIGDEAFYVCASLTGVTIPDSVTSIGDGAFQSCHSLTSVTIPDSVTNIGGLAFYYCTSLTSVTIPDSVTSIGNSAFGRCDSLTSVTIPDSVTSIGGFAFFDCDSLTGVTIPNSVTSIGDSAFNSCTSLTSITVDAANANYKSIDGNLYTKDGKVLIQYAVGKTGTSFAVPDGVISIGVSAFNSCTSLTGVTIPDSVTSIGDSAFAYCDNLTSVIIGNSVTSIGESAFEYLTGYLYYMGTAADWKNVTIGFHTYHTTATCYYYSESAPTEAGNYWHYDAEGKAVVWS